jgi:3-dehydroquinate dehydratase
VISDRLRAFRQGLKDTGYVEGENVAIIYRFAENQIDRLPELPADLVRRQVAVMIATGVGAFVAKAATATIPIVFVAAEDPVRLGLVASIARPDGNLTGINLFNTELVAKRLELLRELVPRAAHIAVLVNPADGASTETTVRDATAAARAIGLQIQILNANTGREIDSAFETMARDGYAALFVGASPYLSGRRVQVAQLAAFALNAELLLGILQLLNVLLLTLPGSPRTTCVIRRNIADLSRKPIAAVRVLELHLVEDLQREPLRHHLVAPGHAKVGEHVAHGIGQHPRSLDFAGGTVVHINSGVAGLMACIALGKRKDTGPTMF